MEGLQNKNKPKIFFLKYHIISFYPSSGCMKVDENICCNVKTLLLSQICEQLTEKNGFMVFSFKFIVALELRNIFIHTRLLPVDVLTV